MTLHLIRHYHCRDMTHLLVCEEVSTRISELSHRVHGDVRHAHDATRMLRIMDCSQGILVHGSLLRTNDTPSDHTETKHIMVLAEQQPVGR